MPFDLFKLAHKEGIAIEYWDFAPPIEAIYFSSNGKSIIALSRSLFSDRRYFRCILAEELGHHFRTAGDLRPRQIFRYRDRLYISKEEYRALKWAAQYLIPLDKLEKAIEEGLHETWELADHFDVTEEMIKFRLELSDIAPLRYVSVK